MIGMYLKKVIPIKMAEFFIPFSQIEVVILWKFDSNRLVRDFLAYMKPKLPSLSTKSSHSLRSRTNFAPCPFCFIKTFNTFLLSNA